VSWVKRNPPPCPTCEKEEHDWDGLTEQEKDDLRYFQKLVFRGLKIKPEDCDDDEDCKLDK
jgi:hypothetical protein